MAKPTPKKSSTGKKADWMAVIGGLIPLLGLIIVFLADKKNKFAMLYAKQSTIFWVLTFVISMIPIIGWILALPLYGITLLVCLWLAYQAYLGKSYKLPVIGDWADKLNI